MLDPSEAPPSPADCALQLPLDFPKKSGKARPKSHAFELAVPPLDARLALRAGLFSASDALLAATFGIALHRYGGQPWIGFDACRLSSEGGAEWSLPVWLRTGEDSTCRTLLHQIDALSPAREEAAKVIGVGGRAGIAWVDAIESSIASHDDYDLRLLLERRGDAYRAALVYDSRAFRPASIERMAGHLRTLLADAAARPDLPIGKLSLLAPAEREALDAWSHGKITPARTDLVHHRFEKHAAEAPSAIAVRYRDGAKSYEQLNVEANRLAHHLASRGIGAECRVVVCLEPGFDIAIALLGILKAGAVYVPIDPGYPPARIEAILDDTQPALLISSERLLEKLPVRGLATLPLDSEHALPAGLPTHDPNNAIDKRQTAYIYYTSGTTGKPKGVMATRENLSSYIQAAHERYAIDEREIVPAIARFSFSISMFELMSPLAAGGTLLMLDREHVLDPARMARTLGEVTFFHAGPSLLKHVIPHIRENYRDFRAFSRVRHASSGGDMVPPELLQAMKEIFSEAEVFVIYGCSEISCMGCTYPVPRDREVAKTYVGRPFDNVVVRVLDPALQPVPMGVTGEICFSGPGVVKGYLHDPERTAEKFVEIDGRRFYRTGDVGRLGEDGWLEILGRNDFQVKIRGMRIELAEVEHHLRQAPGVRDGAVVAKETAPPAEKSLVAYVVFDGRDQAKSEAARPARIAEIRRHMVANLPDYMVPSSYVELDRLPLNHNMKLDRKALPGLERAESRPPAEDSARNPRTPTEKRLASEWSDLLRLAEVRLDDNFFELGGDSMSATSFVLAVERDLGVKLDGIEVLRESLEVLAALCDERAGRRPAAPAARPSAERPREIVETFHFGPDQSLYGVLRRPSGADTGRAVLICPPIGHERVRSHFVLNKLAKRLAERGLGVMHFDYYGSGDSLGDGIDASFGRWQRDVIDAHRELRSRMGPVIVTAVGVRLGGILLCNAASRIELSHLVLWDPVCKGSDYYEEMTGMHQRYVRGTLQLRLGKKPRRIAGAEELLGSTYSNQAIGELRNLAIAPMAQPTAMPIHWLATSHPSRQKALFGAITGARSQCRLALLDFDCHWDQIARSEDILPDAGITAALAEMVLEQPRAVPSRGAVERPVPLGGQAARIEGDA